jgi:septum formation protein
MPNTPSPLILASASRYRRELLGRIVAEFDVQPAAIDESRLAAETPADLAVRLAVSKADRIATKNPGAIVIGSDQVAALGDTALGKPGNAQQAALQLAACSGKQVVFYTSVSLISQQSAFHEQHLDVTTVTFRELSSPEIDRYLELDQPWDCAGSFRAESKGPLLFESIQSNDPTGLIGLPLIWLAGSIQRAGIDLL